MFLTPDQQGAEGAAIPQDQAQFAETLAQEWLQRSAERASKQKIKTLATSELAYVRGNMGEEVQGLGNVVRSAMKSLAKISWFAPTGMAFAERFVNRALAQVTKYLTEEETRKKAQEAVLALIGPETKVLIGHSLGSVVAYEVTHRLDRPLPLPLPLFVTLGSPLGLDSIIYPKLRPKPPAFPILVQRWMNLADRDDFIAAEPDLTKFFSKGVPQGARFEGGYTVDNGAEPHKATFYLKKEKLAWAIAEALRG